MDSKQAGIIIAYQDMIHKEEKLQQEKKRLIELLSLLTTLRDVVED